MATLITEYKLDFTLHLQKCDLPSYQKASAAYTQTVPSAPLKIEFRQQRPGIFIVKTFNEPDAQKLMDKYVTYYYGKNEMNQVKVFLIKLPKFKFYSNAKWVSFDWLNDGNLRFVKNNQLDDFLSEYGDVIVNVEEEKNEFGMLNGRRKARIDLNKGKHMERVQWLEFEVELEDGSKQKAKGKVKIFYQGQPVFCKRCSKDHDKKCPAQIKEEESLKDYEMKRQEKCINFTVSDSEFRHANQKALFSDTNVASGAKIGHIANVLENTDLLGYKNIVVNAGLNNMMLNCNTNIEKWQAQLTQEVGI